MPDPKPPRVELMGEKRRELEGLVRRHKTGQQVAERAQELRLSMNRPGS